MDFHRKDYIKAKSRKLKLKANAATIIGEKRLLELLEHAFAGIAMDFRRRLSANIARHVLYDKE